MSTKKNNEKAPRPSPATPKSTPPKNDKAEKLESSEAERAAELAADTRPNPVVSEERGESLQNRVERERAERAAAPPPAPKPAPPVVIVPPPPPLTETERLQKRVAELESELLHIQRNASVDFTRLHNVLHGK